jgi:hypothetical protein
MQLIVTGVISTYSLDYARRYRKHATGLSNVGLYDTASRFSCSVAMRMAMTLQERRQSRPLDKQRHDARSNEQTQRSGGSGRGNLAGSGQARLNPVANTHTALKRCNVPNSAEHNGTPAQG